MVANMSDADVWRLNRGGHDPHKVYAAYAAAVKHKGQPTVILAKTVKGYGMGAVGEGKNVAHQQKKMPIEALKQFRDRFNIPIPDDKLAELPYYKPADDSPEMKYLKELRAQLLQVLHLRRIVGRLVVGQLGELVVGDRDVEAVAELLERLDGHLLLLVGDVLAFAHGAHAVALHGLREDYRGLALVLHRRRVRRVHLVRIVAAAVQAPHVRVGHVGHHRPELRVLAEEMLAHIGAVAALELLVLAVDRLFHALQQEARLVAGDERIPIGAPDHLDHVPAGATEIGLELLDDLAVAAHRAVEALQVAVHHEDEVVEVLARGHADRAEGFGLVHLAVAHEGPHLALGRLRVAAILQVVEEARLVDRLDRAQAHRHRGKLPEVGHEPRVRIRRDTLAVDFLAEVVELRFGQAALEERARVA